MSSPSVAAERAQLARGEHADPHHLLGAHPGEGGVRIRVWRPEAVAVAAVLADGEQVELDETQTDGLFEGTIAGAELPLAYRLEVRYPDGGDWGYSATAVALFDQATGGTGNPASSK